MQLDITRVIMEILASIIIQFTPVDSFFEKERTWTWGDNKSIWYIVEPVKKDKNTAVFTIIKYEGEVRTSDSIMLIAKKNKDGKYYWTHIQESSTSKVIAFKKNIKENSWKNSKDKVFYSAIWEGMNKKIKLSQTNEIEINKIKCEELVFFKGKGNLTIILDKTKLIGFSLSQSGKGFNEAEEVIKLVNPNQ